jgi:hypothetical protein
MSTETSCLLTPARRPSSRPRRMSTLGMSQRYRVLLSYRSFVEPLHLLALPISGGWLHRRRVPMTLVHASIADLCSRSKSGTGPPFELASWLAVCYACFCRHYSTRVSIRACRHVCNYPFLHYERYAPYARKAVSLLVPAASFQRDLTSTTRLSSTMHNASLHAFLDPGLGERIARHPHRPSITDFDHPIQCQPTNSPSNSARMSAICA